MPRNKRPELLSVTQAAELLGVTRQAVLKRLNRGTIKGEKVGKTWNVYADQLEHPKPRK